MAQDYASRQRKRIKPDKTETLVQAPVKNRGAIPRPVEEKVSPSAALGFWARLPGWGWLALGLMLGFFIANLSQESAPTPFEEKPPLVVIEAKKVPQPVVSNTDQGAEKSSEKPTDSAAPRFDFYTLLPESEVVAPEVEAYKSTPREAENQPRYMLQVGSFRSKTDAGKQQERLKSLGYDQIRISEVTTANGDTWYRVQVGPYQDRRLLARAQNELAKVGFDFMLLRLKD